MNQDIKLSREQRQAAIGQMVDRLRASQAATDMMDEAFCDFLGINRTDGRCIDIIERLGEVTAGTLAAEMGLTTGAVTAVVDRLEVAGLVERTRDPDDRRKVILDLTAEAKQIAAEAYGQVARATEPFIDQLSDRDLLTLISFFEASQRVNHEVALSLRERTQKRTIPLRQRVEQLRELKKEAKRIARATKHEWKDWVKVDFLIGDTRWVQDDNGRWVEEKA